MANANNGGFRCVNCPINECTGDGVLVGRCWYHLEEGYYCPRHGNVNVEVDHYQATGKTTPETPEHRPERRYRPIS